MWASCPRRLTAGSPTATGTAPIRLLVQRHPLPPDALSPPATRSLACRRRVAPSGRRWGSAGPSDPFLFASSPAGAVTTTHPASTVQAAHRPVGGCAAGLSPTTDHSPRARSASTNALTIHTPPPGSNESQSQDSTRSTHPGTPLSSPGCPPLGCRPSGAGAHAAGALKRRRPPRRGRARGTGAGARRDGFVPHRNHTATPDGTPFGTGHQPLTPDDEAYHRHDHRDQDPHAPTAVLSRRPSSTTQPRRRAASTTATPHGHVQVAGVIDSLDDGGHVRQDCLHLANNTADVDVAPSPPLAPSPGSGSRLPVRAPRVRRTIGPPSAGATRGLARHVCRRRPSDGHDPILNREFPPSY